MCGRGKGFDPPHLQSSIFFFVSSKRHRLYGVYCLARCLKPIQVSRRKPSVCRGPINMELSFSPSSPSLRIRGTTKPSCFPSSSSSSSSIRTTKSQSLSSLSQCTPNLHSFGLYTCSRTFLNFHQRRNSIWVCFIFLSLVSSTHFGLLMKYYKTFDVYKY